MVNLFMVMVWGWVLGMVWLILVLILVSVVVEYSVSVVFIIRVRWCRVKWDEVLDVMWLFFVWCGEEVGGVGLSICVVVKIEGLGGL